MNLNDLAAAAGGAGPGGFLQGVTSGLVTGTQLREQNRRTDLEERRVRTQESAEQAQHLDRVLNLFDKLDEHPDKAEAIKAVGKKYGVDVDAITNGPANVPAGFRPEATLVKLQRDEKVPDDELTALLHYARRDKSGVMRTQLNEIMERGRQSNIQTRFNSALEQYKADNPGASDIDAQRALAAKDTQFRELFTGGKGGGGIKDTIGPELTAEQKLVNRDQPKVAYLVGLIEQGKIDAKVGIPELLALNGGKDAIATGSPTLKAYAARLGAGATEQGKIEGLTAPVPGAPPTTPPAAAGTNLSDVAPLGNLSATMPPAARPSGLVFPGQAKPAVPAPAPGAPPPVANLSDVSGMQPSPSPVAQPPAMAPTPPATAPKTYGDLQGQQKGKEAEAAVTSVQRGHLAESQARTKIQQERADAYVEMKNRVGATIKTLEGTIQQTAAKTFPDDPVKQAALAARMKNMLTGIASMVNSDQDAATIEQNIRDEIAKMKGEVKAITPEAKRAAGGWFSLLLNAVADTGGVSSAVNAARGAAGEPSTPARRSAPGRDKSPAAPEPVMNDPLRAARDALINAMYPGRRYRDLTVDEKQEVVNRLNGTQ
jgi:hypothetical protein